MQVRIYEAQCYLYNIVIIAIVRFLKSGGPVLYTGNSSSLKASSLVPNQSNVNDGSLWGLYGCKKH